MKKPFRNYSKITICSMYITLFLVGGFFLFPVLYIIGLILKWL